MLVRHRLQKKHVETQHAADLIFARGSTVHGSQHNRPPDLVPQWLSCGSGSNIQPCPARSVLRGSSCESASTCDLAFAICCAEGIVKHARETPLPDGVNTSPMLQPLPCETKSMLPYKGYDLFPTLSCEDPCRDEGSQHRKSSWLHAGH